jgi:hypothetical protein
MHGTRGSCTKRERQTDTHTRERERDSTTKLGCTCILRRKTKREVGFSTTKLKNCCYELGEEKTGRKQTQNSEREKEHELAHIERHESQERRQKRERDGRERERERDERGRERGSVYCDNRRNRVPFWHGRRKNTHTDGLSDGLRKGRTDGKEGRTGKKEGRKENKRQRSCFFPLSFRVSESV